MNFKEYLRVEELGLLLNEDPYYNKEFIGLMQRVRGQGQAGATLTDFLGRVGRKMGGGGLGSLPNAIWDSVKRRILRGRPETKQYPPISMKSLCLDRQGCASELEGTFAIMKQIGSGAGVDKEALLPVMVAYNKMLKKTLTSPTIDFLAYHNGLKNFYDNPGTMIMAPSAAMREPNTEKKAEIDELPSPTPDEKSIVKDAAAAIEQSVRGTPYEAVVMNAVRDALKELTDEQLGDIASKDKRFRSSRQEIKSDTGFSWRDIRSAMGADEELKSRYDSVARMMKGKRKSKPENQPEPGESWPRPPLMNYSEFD